jgi:hypothetical protein
VTCRSKLVLKTAAVNRRWRLLKLSATVRTAALIADFPVGFKANRPD